MTALEREGYRRARRLTRLHARSFSVASVLLFGARRRAAFALYAFCRRMDDAVDMESRDGVEARLAQARTVVEALFSTAADTARTLEGVGPWHPAELAALRDTLRRYAIPKAPFVDFLAGMEMDVRYRPYRRFAELDRYCYCVAGTVGLMLCPVLGAHEESALDAAADLGRAMQLTNILRDVQEDLARGRVYLPQEELSAFGLGVEDLRQGLLDDRMRAFLRCQIARARAFYARAGRGVGLLRGMGTQRMVRLMGGLYGGILTAIEERGYDVFSGRAHVSRRQKLFFVLRALFRPGTLLPAPYVEPPIPLLPTETST